MARSSAPPGEARILYEIISTVASSLDLEEVLTSVVRLLTEASAAHACFVYLAEDGGERLVLRAASDPYADLVGTIALERGEGLAWWAAERRQPAFIRENALADRRFKYFPELEEEKFQSLVSVPVIGKDGDPVAAITLHTEAPREFSDDEVELLSSTAQLVCGAIENARLYDEMRRRVWELERLTDLGEAIVRAETLEELAPIVVERSAELLRASACHLYLTDEGADELHWRASDGVGAEPRPTIPFAKLGPEVARSGRSARVAVPLVAGDELLGLLLAEDTVEVDLGRAVANQAALAIKKIDLIERLTEKNLIKDFFEQLAGGRSLGGVEERAIRLGCDLDGRYVVLAATPADDRLERALATIAPGSIFDRRDDSMRALMRVPPAGEATLLAAVRRVHEKLGAPAAIGVSNACRGAASFVAGFEEARHALLGTTLLTGRAVTSYDELGPYKYLLRMSFDPGVRDAHRDAIAKLANYDRERSTQLLRTLEEFLRRRGSIASTADALYIHANTLRQRLRRIMELSGIDLRKDDWLMVEIALKMVKLEEALEAGEGDIPPPQSL